MSDNIVERLHLLVPSDSSSAAFDAVNEITRLRNELHIAQEWSARVIAGHEQDITEITALRAKNEKLRAALEEMVNEAAEHHAENVSRAELGGSDMARRKAKAIVSRSGVLLYKIKYIACAALEEKP